MSGSTGPWAPDAAGVLRLPSGVLLRGRGLRHGPPGGLSPDFGLYLLGEEPPSPSWEADWVPWPDFRLPKDPRGARVRFAETLARAASERVEVACGGGVGRTGTALACMAVLDGVPADEAVAYVRRHYHRRAVETPWQRRFVRRFGRDDGD
ncbi:protein-tyrosine phosphatase family protein [Streptomyces sp. GSL17-111]|uniref:protein-tyrosine phosphatase family protein n=1 Tax=Streptomyces sp. GSL17-111 TaxID=3121596 RepID=UPI0030F41E1F